MSLLASRLSLFPVIQDHSWLFLEPGFLSMPTQAEISGPGISLAHSTTGGVSGTVRIESKIQPKSLAFNLYSRTGKAPAAKKPDTPMNELENIVVYLEGRFENTPSKNSNWAPAGRFASRQQNPTIRQVNETFTPHVLSIKVGTTVHFPNGDPFFHNVFSLSGAKSFDLGRYPQNQTRSVRFDRPGIVKVFCHIHSHMSAVIMVFAHPYFSAVNDNGKFFIDSVPPGEYLLVAWHERLKPQRKQVTIRPGEDLRLEIIL